MGRSPLPPGERALRGNAGKRKPRTVTSAGSRGDYIEPPHWLKNPTARAEWDRIVPELMRMRVLAGMDHAPLGMYCQAFASWVGAHAVIAEKGSTYLTQSKHGEMERIRPEVKIAAEAERTMLRYGQQFGLAPLSRTKVASGFLANGQQLTLPGFDGPAPPTQQGESNGHTISAQAAKDDAGQFFGYH
jgi:P27 family predicted phage terminase small subunit